MSQAVFFFYYWNTQHTVIWQSYLQANRNQKDTQIIALIAKKFQGTLLLYFKNGLDCFFPLDSVIDYSWIKCPIYHYFLFSGNWSSSFSFQAAIQLTCLGPAVLVLYGWCPFSVVDTSLIPMVKYFQYHFCATIHTVTAIDSQLLFFSNMTIPPWSQSDGAGKGI